MKKFLTLGIGTGLIATAVIPFSSAFNDAYNYYRSYNTENKPVYAYHAYMNGYTSFGGEANPRYDYPAVGQTRRGIVYQTPQNYRNSVSRPRSYTNNPYYAYNQSQTTQTLNTRRVVKPIKVIRINNQQQAYVRPLSAKTLCRNTTTNCNTNTTPTNITIINSIPNYGNYAQRNNYEIKASVPYSYTDSDGKKVITDVRPGDRITFSVEVPSNTGYWGNVAIDWDYQLERLNCTERGNQLSCQVRSEYPAIVTAKFKVFDRDGIAHHDIRTDSVRISPTPLNNRNYRNQQYQTYQDWYRYQ